MTNLYLRILIGVFILSISSTAYSDDEAQKIIVIKEAKLGVETDARAVAPVVDYNRNTTKPTVTLVIPSRFSQLSPEIAKAAYDKLSAAVSRLKLVVSPNLKDAAPGTSFEGEDPLVTFDALNRHRRDQVPGEQRRGAPLNEEQFASIKASGEFEANLNYPSHANFRVRPLFIKGLKNIQATLQKAKDQKAYVLEILIPEKLRSKNKASLRRGFTAFVSSVRDTVSLVVGLKENTAKYSDKEVSQFIDNAALEQSVIESDPKEVDARLMIPEFQVAVSERLSSVVIDSEASWSEVEEEYRNLLTESLKGQGEFVRQIILREFRSYVDQMVQEEGKLDKKKFLTELPTFLQSKVAEAQSSQAAALYDPASMPNLPLEFYVQNIMAELKQATLFESILLDENLDNLQIEITDPKSGEEKTIDSRGIAKALLRNIQSQRVIAFYEGLFQRAREAKLNTVLLELKNAHPKKAANPYYLDWFREQAEIAMRSYYQKEAPTFRYSVETALQQKGLNEQAALFVSQFNTVFNSDDKRADLKSAKIPARTFSWGKRVWRAKNWPVVEDYTGRKLAVPYKEVRVETDRPFWRIKNTFGAGKVSNILFNVWHHGLINGPWLLNLKAFGTRYYGAKRKIYDESTGESTVLKPGQMIDENGKVVAMGFSKHPVTGETVAKYLKENPKYEGEQWWVKSIEGDSDSYQGYTPTPDPRKMGWAHFAGRDFKRLAASIKNSKGFWFFDTPTAVALTKTVKGLIGYPLLTAGHLLSFGAKATGSAAAFAVGVGVWSTPLIWAPLVGLTAHTWRAVVSDSQTVKGHLSPINSLATLGATGVAAALGYYALPWLASFVGLDMGSPLIPATLAALTAFSAREKLGRTFSMVGLADLFYIATLFPQWFMEGTINPTIPLTIGAALGFVFPPNGNRNTEQQFGNFDLYKEFIEKGLLTDLREAGLSALDVLFFKLGWNSLFKTPAAYLRSFWSQATDSFVYSFASGSNPLTRIFSSGMTLPERNSWFVQQLDGEGLKEDYFWQLNDDRTLLVIKARLELLALKNFRERARTLLVDNSKEAWKKFASEFREVKSVLALQRYDDRSGEDRDFSQAWPEFFREINSETEAELSEILDASIELLTKLTQLPVYGKIRWKKDNLIEVLQRATLITKDHFEPLLKTFRDQNRTAFWTNAGLEEGDWSGLAMKTFAEAFGGPAALVPFEDEKVAAVIADDPESTDLVKAIIGQHSPEDLSRVIIRLPQAKQKGEVVDIEFPYYSGNDHHPNSACELLLSGDSDHAKLKGFAAGF